MLVPLGVTSSPEGPTRTWVCVPARLTTIFFAPSGARTSTISQRLRPVNQGSFQISCMIARVFGFRSSMRAMRGRQVLGVRRLRSFIGPLLIGGGGGGLSIFLGGGMGDSVGLMWVPDAIS